MLLSLIVSLLLQTPRNQGEIRRFQIYTGHPGGWTGHVVDHKIPLCAGGPDTMNNMQWEEIKESYVKDNFERQLCAEMKRQGFILVKR